MTLSILPGSLRLFESLEVGRPGMRHWGKEQLTRIPMHHIPKTRPSLPACSPIGMIWLCSLWIGVLIVDRCRIEIVPNVAAIVLLRECEMLRRVHDGQGSTEDQDAEGEHRHQYSWRGDGRLRVYKRQPSLRRVTNGHTATVTPASLCLAHAFTSTKTSRSLVPHGHTKYRSADH